MTRTRSRFSGVFFGTLILFLSATMSFGATWYTATSGSDMSTGTQDNPFATIQHAVDAATDGDTVMVEAGTYSGGITISNDGITLQSVSGAAATTIEGGTTGITVACNDVTIQGFGFKNAVTGINIASSQATNLTFSSNIFNNLTVGITQEFPLQDCSLTISDNTMRNVDAGIYLDKNMGENDQPVNIRITGNTMTDCDIYGIAFISLYSGTVEISENSLADCTGNAIIIGKTGSGGKEISFNVEKNIISLSDTETGNFGIFITSAERTTRVTENTVTGNYKSGIYVETVGNEGAAPALFYMEDNVVVGSERGITLTSAFLNFGGSAYLRGNTIADVTTFGVGLADLGWSTTAEGFTLTFEENLILACDQGLFLTGLFRETTGTVSIRNNNFRNNQTGLEISPANNNFAGSDFVIDKNNFDDNGVYGLLNGTVEMVDATNNWWGDETGPYDGKMLPGTPNYNNLGGLGDEVSSYVDYDGWGSARYSGSTGSSASSGGGCTVGGLSPGMLLLLLPLAGLFRRK